VERYGTLIDRGADLGGARLLVWFALIRETSAHAYILRRRIVKRFHLLRSITLNFTYRYTFCGSDARFSGSGRSFTWVAIFVVR
jgi:hypothetical protein